MSPDSLHALSVAVLAGGWSDEREISLVSAEAVCTALKEAGFLRVDLLDVADEDFGERLATGRYDVAFVAMHGPIGEDGCIQGLLEVLRIPYTFSGVLASAMGSEKGIAKAIYHEAGIPTPKGVALNPRHIPDDDEVEAIVAEFGLPLFVKPAANGSSYGVTKVTEASQLVQAVRDARAGDGRVLIEECVVGTEITVPVLGNGDDTHALVVIEVVTGAEFYDLKVKYEPSELHHVIPARLDPEVYARAQQLAVRAHKVLNCRDVSRSDFIVKADGTPVILETNTIPGMTPSSLLPDSARHEGIEFPQLCSNFVEWAFMRGAKGM